MTITEPPYKNGLISLEMEGRPNKKLAVIWSFEGYKNLRAVANDAVKYFDEHGGQPAEYMYVAKLPNGIETGTSVPFPHSREVILFEADWMIAGHVLVCGQG
jgi:hypothetical protein